MTKTRRAVTWLMVAFVWIVLCGVLAVLVSRGRIRPPVPVDDPPPPEINFVRGTARVSDRSYDDVDSVAARLLNDSELHVKIVGHASGTTPEEIRHLAEQRAGTIKKWFEAAGIDEKRIETSVDMNSKMQPGATFEVRRIVRRPR